MELWKLLSIAAVGTAAAWALRRLLAPCDLELPSVNTRIEPRGYTAQELAEHKGDQGDPSDIYVAVKGVVYWVTPQHYGPGASYECFAGSEASYRLGKSLLGRANQNRDWRGDILDADEQDTLNRWAAAFERKYPVVGWFVFPESTTQQPTDDEAEEESNTQENRSSDAAKAAVQAMLRDGSTV
jgi:membrane-associated progesterone receptor component